MRRASGKDNVNKWEAKERAERFWNLRTLDILLEDDVMTIEALIELYCIYKTDLALFDKIVKQEKPLIYNKIYKIK
jgi:hypothetical protein